MQAISCSCFPVNDLLVARQINKKWNREALVVIRRRRSPLVSFTLDHENLVVGSQCMTTGPSKESLLLDLHKMVGTDDDKPVPSYRLVITPGMFQAGSRRGFEKLIREHGSSLVELSITASTEQAQVWFSFHS